MTVTEKELLLPASVTADVLARAARIRLACFDVDGVLTDGRLVFGHGGEELKSFHVQDGLGIKLLQQHGIAVALITARESTLVARRASELGIGHVHQGAVNKLAVFTTLLSSLSLRPEQAAYTGDDLPDVCVMRRCGLAVAVANANAQVKPHAHWQTSKSGGDGAVREVADLLLSAQGHMHAIVSAAAGL